MMLCYFATLFGTDRKCNMVKIIEEAQTVVQCAKSYTILHRQMANVFVPFQTFFFYFSTS